MPQSGDCGTFPDMWLSLARWSARCSTPIRSAPHPVTLLSIWRHISTNCHIPQKYWLRHFCLLTVTFFSIYCHIFPRGGSPAPDALPLDLLQLVTFPPLDSFPIKYLPSFTSSYFQNFIRKRLWWPKMGLCSFSQNGGQCLNFLLTFQPP